MNNRDLIYFILFLEIEKKKTEKKTKEKWFDMFVLQVILLLFNQVQS